MKPIGMLCYNCGDRGHKLRDCPEKSKGTKCFNCNDYGHVANKCPKITEDSGASGTRAVNVIHSSNTVKLQVQDVTIEALFNTGSDVNII